MKAPKRNPPMAPAGSRETSSSISGEKSLPIAQKPEPRQATVRKRGGRRPRDKGNRFERSIVRALQSKGIAAERVPLSGAAGGSYRGDISVPCFGTDLRIEVKARAAGFASLYSWLEGRDALVVRANRKEPLAVIPLRLAAEVLAAAENWRSFSEHQFREAVRPRENGCSDSDQGSRSPGHCGQFKPST